MSASSSIAAAKRRRGGAPPAVSQPGQRPSSGSPNVLTPQQRALLLQQQQIMAQKGQLQQQNMKPPQNVAPVYNPNISNQTSSANSSNFQVVPGPNGVSVPVGPDGKPLHPGVLIMDHEKRISDLEKSLSYGNSINQMRQFDGNTVNIVVEEGESAPWEEDIGMLSLRMDELTKRITNVELLRQQQSNTNVSSVTVNDQKVSELQLKVELLERQLTSTKELLLKVQAFSMETNTSFLKFQNSFEQSKPVFSNDFDSLKVLEEDGADIKAWVDSSSLNLQTENLDDLSVNELEITSQNEENNNEQELESE